MRRTTAMSPLGVTTVFTTLIVLLQLTTVPVVGQAPSATAWGHPNLEGIWLDVYATPFERASELGAREFCDPRKKRGRTGSGAYGRRWA